MHAKNVPAGDDKLMMIPNTGKITVVFFVIAAFVLAVGVASAADYYVATTGDDTTGDGSMANPWRTIQYAVDNVSAGNTIIVQNGTYGENVLVNKSLTIRSQYGAAYTTVQATSIFFHVFNVTADWVNITGFTLRGANLKAGIHLYFVEHCNISNNNATSNGVGMLLNSSSNNNLTNNIVSGNSYLGIQLVSSSNNNLTGNNASNNVFGIQLVSSSNNTLTDNNALYIMDHGIHLISSSYNNLIGNNASYKPEGFGGITYGINLESSSNYNNLTGNNVSDHFYGINLESSSHNNLTGNNASYNSTFSIRLMNSSHNNLISNIASYNNVHGIYLLSSSNYNNLIGNNVSDNNYDGISLSSSSYNNLTGNTVSNNRPNHGIQLVSSSNDNTLTNNTANANGKYGIYLVSSSYNNLTRNTANANGNFGIYLWQLSNDNTLTNNTANANGNYGIYLDYYSSYNNLTGNNASDNRYGIYLLRYSSYNNLIGNIASNNNEFGIVLYYSSYNNLTRNIASYNGGYGIYLYLYTSNNNLIGNNASYNDRGIYLRASNNNNLTSNTVSSNDCGIYLYASSDNSLASNTVSNNYYGIYLYSPLAGAIAYNDTYKVVYFSFGFEGINNSDMRDTVMNRTINWLYPSLSESILLVDDDLGAAYESYYNASLIANSINYDYWDTFTKGSPTYDNLSSYPVVIWFTGDDSSSTLTPIEQSALAQYLDAGGNLFLTGQDIGYDIAGTSVFYSNYLHATYVMDDTGKSELAGMAGDPISGGLLIGIADGDGANNQDYPSGILPRENATMVFYYVDSNNISCNLVHHNTYCGFFLTGVNNTGNTIEYNNIVANGIHNGMSGGYEYNFVNNQSATVDAKYNWWGTAVSSEIAASINENTGSVDFSGYLNWPSPCAPGVPLLAVTKTVWDGTAWVKEVPDAYLNDTVRFNCTITNIGGVNITDIRFWDILDCSLVFSGNATLKNTIGVVINDSIVLEGNDTYTFKPKVLHPHNLSWNPYSPSLGEGFTELCPDTGHLRALWGWEDTNNDGRISECDQINLSGQGSLYSFHVENVPYTLTVTNNQTGESMYLETLYNDYEAVNLSDDTEDSTIYYTKWFNVGWTEACCSGDCYIIDTLNDTDGNGKLSVNDILVLSTWNEYDGWLTVEYEYVVTELAIDLVVSREWDINDFADPDVLLEPGQSLTLEYNATDIRCGHDYNTFVAKGLYEGNWIYSNKDSAIVEVPPRPAVETDLTVWNGTAWAKEVTVLVNDTLNFSWMVHNNGTCCDLKNIDGMLTFGGSEITKDDLEEESLAPCSEVNGTLEVPALECGTYTVRWNVSAECVEDYREGALAEDTVTVTVLCPELEVDKTVWDGTTWVKALDASIGDTVRFNCTITNSGKVNLTQIRFWDILDCSLNFSGNETLDLSGEVKNISLEGTYVFKPRVLHPDNLSWNPYKPLPSVLGTYPVFTELCPNNATWYLQDWEDTNNDSRVSACDQIFFEGVALYGHVENVPYTLLVNSTATNTSMYIDSIRDYASVNLSTPNNTEWLEICCCKDRYNVTAWSDMNSTGDLNVGDSLVLLNQRTGAAATYVVEEVTIDLVVSHEWEMDTLLFPDTIIFEPGQTITLEYNASVVKCGVDNNTFRAKGNLSYTGGYAWIYSNEEQVTITVSCPYADATDSAGASVEIYYTNETVYATGCGFKPNSLVDIYITEDKLWIYGMDINSTIYKLAENVPTNASGCVFGFPLWPNPEPGTYDLVIDANQDGKLDAGDGLDGFADPGFMVLERALSQVPALTPIGIAALIGLLSVIATSTLIRRKKR